MDAKDQNKVIATLLGKCTHPISDWVHEGPDGDREIICGTCRQRPYTVGFPDYTSDLNAMHEAEEVARQNQFHFVEYPRALFAVVTGKTWDGDMGYFFFNLVNATAAQRAEAFLRTVGKWQD